MVGVDVSHIQGFSTALKEAPLTLLKEIAKGFQRIGRFDLDRFRKTLTHLQSHKSSGGVAKAFKYKATDFGRATNFSKLFLSLYTTWKPAEIFETGGKIFAKGKSLTVMFRQENGRVITQAKLRSMLSSGQARFIPTPRGVLIVEDVIKLTKGLKAKGQKTGKNRSNILGILKKSVTEQKRINFFSSIQSNDGFHQEVLETAVENTLLSIDKLI